MSGLIYDQLSSSALRRFDLLGTPRYCRSRRWIDDRTFFLKHRISFP